MEKTLFSALPLSESMQLALVELGFEFASQIQAEAIPFVLEGRDVIGQAQTGTGKTAAYGIPMIEKLDTTSRQIGALVVCPTRELTVQVATELKKMARFKKPGVSIQPIFGGDSMQKQLKNLEKGCHIVVGTPGRLIDHLKRGSIDLSGLSIVVLDEADEMLNMGFREDIETILATMPVERQTVLFSATMPKPIMDIARKFQKNPAHVKVVSENLTAASIEQIWFEIRSEQRLNVLADLMDFHGLNLTLCFCNMKVQVDDLVADLRRLGFRADGLHGDLNQNQRTSVLNSFREGGLQILVATDVAARGIDVNDVDAVFNWELPFDSEYYVHRIGRTGRAGKTGKAFSFVTGRNEFRRLKNIEAFAKMRVEKKMPPTEHDLFDIQKAKLLAKLQANLASGSLRGHEELAKEFMEAGFTPHLLAAALLKIGLPNLPAGPRPEPKPSFSVEKKKDFDRPEKWAKPSGDRPFKPGKDFKKPDFGKKSKPDFAVARPFEKPKKGSGKPFKSKHSSIPGLVEVW